MFLISPSCDCFRPHMKRNRVTSMRQKDLLLISNYSTTSAVGTFLNNKCLLILEPKKFSSVSSFMTCPKFLLNVCFVIENLSR